MPGPTQWSNQGGGYQGNFFKCWWGVPPGRGGTWNSTWYEFSDYFLFQSFSNYTIDVSVANFNEVAYGYVKTLAVTWDEELVNTGYGRGAALLVEGDVLVYPPGLIH